MTLLALWRCEFIDESVGDYVLRPCLSLVLWALEENVTKDAKSSFLLLIFKKTK